MTIRLIASLKTAGEFKAYLNETGVSLPFDETVQTGAGSPLAQPCVFGDRVIGNRFAVLPLEGWDGTLDGRPTELTRRHWTGLAWYQHWNGWLPKPLNIRGYVSASLCLEREGVFRKKSSWYFSALRRKH